MTNTKEFFMRDAEAIEADEALINSFKAKVEKGFEILDVSAEEKSISLKVEPRYSHEESFSLVHSEFVGTDFFLLYRREEGYLDLTILKKLVKKRKISPQIHTILLIATFITVTWAGYIWWADANFPQSVMFAVALMAILGGHELGHTLMARRRSIDSTLPFFIPAPPLFPFGTFGAVIFMNSPVPNRKSLLDVGMSGPILGFLLSLPFVIIGLEYSRVAIAVPEEAPFALGPSLLFLFLVRRILGSGSPFVTLHPLAAAGWAGFFVTALNLLPMGQLDGGHVVRGVFPRYYKKIYYGIAVLLLLLTALWPGWLLWVVLIAIMTRLDHPGPLDDVTELDQGRRIMAVVILVIFILCFMPLPVIPTEMLRFI